MSFATNDDIKLWEDFRADKEYALIEIYNKYIDLLFNYGKKLTEDKELIKDTIQELFIDLIRNRNKIGYTDCICFYLLKILKRKLQRKIKYRKKKYILGYNESDLTYFNSDGEDKISTNIEEQIINNEPWE